MLSFETRVDRTQTFNGEGGEIGRVVTRVFIISDIK